MKKIWYVDIPLGSEGEWRNVSIFNSKEEALAFIHEHIDGTSKNGEINLITEREEYDTV